VSPLIVQGDPEHGWLPVDQTTVYPVMGLPLSPGAVQLTVAWAFPAVAVTAAGAPGDPLTVGVTAFEGADTGPAPTEFVAYTVNV
jgi:hypothetical protein